MRTVAIVQARMGSTRLPGKVLAEIGGRPMLAHVVERARAAPGVDEVVVATSVLPEDDAIAALCASAGWACERGSATDLLDRYERAATAHEAEIVVRVTGDCPLLDPALVGEVVALLDEGGYDYASNTLEPRTWPHGLDAEAFTRAALATAWTEDTDPAWREHVTPFLYRHPERFRLGRLDAPTDLSGLRLTVDTPEDLALARAVHAELGHASTSWQAVVGLLEQRPDLRRLNAGVPQRHVGP